MVLFLCYMCTPLSMSRQKQLQSHGCPSANRVQWSLAKLLSTISLGGSREYSHNARHRTELLLSVCYSYMQEQKKKKKDIHGPIAKHFKQCLLYSFLTRLYTQMPLFSCRLQGLPSVCYVAICKCARNDGKQNVVVRSLELQQEQ